MAKTVGILTMHRVHNCGSFLQAYATQEAIRKLGYNAKVIDYHYPNAYHYKKLCISASDYVYSWRNMFHHLRHLRFKEAKEMLYHLRFNVLINRKLRLTKPYLLKEDLYSVPPAFDIYCVGSDQVWNPHYCFQDASFFLGFAPAESRKISYSSSITIDEVSSEQRSYMISYLKQFSAISVREKNSSVLLKDYLAKEPHVVLDPVFLLSANDWQKKMKFRQQRKKYVFYYVLNYMSDVKGDAERILSEVRTSGKYDEIVDLRDHPHLFPAQFVKLIANAGLVITDSFHATAFSYIFDTPVTTILPAKGHDVRIKDLQERIVVEGSLDKINQLKADSLLFLTKALQGDK